MGVSKNRGKTPKMDGENNGKPYEQMDDLGGFPTIFGSTPILYHQKSVQNEVRTKKHYCWMVPPKSCITLNS